MGLFQVTNDLEYIPLSNTVRFLAHALTLNEIAFDVALKLQQRNQERPLAIDYLEQDNPCEFVLDAAITKEVFLDMHSVQLSSSVSAMLPTSSWFRSRVLRENLGS